jgi:oligopeptide/dipeptide ABC transporter ATP-binding protein
MPESEKILSIQGLSNHFLRRSAGFFAGDEKIDVLQNVTFAIGRGETFGLVGESGCGKSTLARAIVGLVETQGDIVIDGEKVSAKRTKQQRKKVQIVFQDPLSSLNPTKNIGWILEEPLRIHGIGNHASRLKRVSEVLELVGLDPDYRSRYPSELSGGQRQRVSIGSALMLNPKLIIADEPVSALDVSVQAQILNLMKDLRDSLNLSYLFISHNLNVVYYLCDRVAVMYLGRIVELADVETLYSTPLHPYTQMLLSAIPEIGAEPDKTAEITGEADADRTALNGCAFYKRCQQACEKCRLSVPELRERSDKKASPQSSHLVRCHCADYAAAKTNNIGD